MFFYILLFFFFFQAEDGIRDHCVTGVQTCALPIVPAIELLPQRLVQTVSAPESSVGARPLRPGLWSTRQTLGPPECVWPVYHQVQRVARKRCCFCAPPRWQRERHQSARCRRLDSASTEPEPGVHRPDRAVFELLPALCFAPA